MKKNTVKLNEAQLKKIVAESINKVLSELDWKTYANARKKAADKGQYDRSMKFGNAADSAFNDKFGYQGDEDSEYYAPNVRGNIFLNRVEAQNNDYPSHTIQHLYDYDNDKQEYSNPRNYDNTKAFGLMDKYDKDGRYKRIWNPSLKRFFNNPEQEKAYRTASKEMDDYVMGNYAYDSDNGWQLKENKIAKIVAESVRKVLKEDDRAEIANTLGKMREAWVKIVEASNFLYPLIEEAENNPDMKYGERLLKFDKLVNMMKDTLIIGSPSPSGYFADDGA